MAKKSKTQRAKASANRAAKKERAAQEALEAQSAPVVEEEPKKKGFSFGKKSSPAKKEETKAPQKQQKKAVEKPKKKRFAFLSDVRSEMRRVTWPSRQDVLQWSGVVVVALLFFGVFVAVLDNWVVTPILLAISSLGA